MSYTTKEIADLAGVTPRTLRYYDQIDLLLPREVGQNGYRYYDRGSLLRLQQILFFRELEVPLKEIRRILNSQEFDPLSALTEHRFRLEEKVKRLERLIRTIEGTIANLEGKQTMKEQDYFRGFDEAKYQQEVQERWGGTPQYLESHQNWFSYDDDQRKEIAARGRQLIQEMVTDDPQVSPQDPRVQAAIEKYFQYLNRYFYRCDLEMFQSLAEMWVEDPRFAVNYETIREGGAAFVLEAVCHYCAR